MQALTLARATNRFYSWLMPFLLGISLVACGGGGGEASTASPATGSAAALLADTSPAISDASLAATSKGPQNNKPSKKATGLSLIAGNIGGPGSVNATGVAARFNNPVGIAADTAGNLYVVDQVNSTIRKITPAGVVTTLAGTPGVPGSADGSGAAARFRNPSGIAADMAGNLFVTDQSNQTIRKITSAGVVTTLAGTAGVQGSADGSGTAAQFSNPSGIAADTAGNLYVADFSNAIIRKITAAGVVTTLAGTAGVTGSADGSGAAAQFNSPSGITIDTAGNLFVADTGNQTIRKITAAAGVVTTLAGTAGVTGSANGNGAAAQFNYPFGIAADMSGNLFVADTNNSTIRKITTAGTVTTLAGTASVQGSADGSGAAAQFNRPLGITADSAGNVFVADTANNSIRKITAAGVVTTLAGTPSIVGSADGSGAAAQFSYPFGIAADTAGNLFVADANINTIRKITPAGVVTTLAGTAGVMGSADGSGAAAQFNRPLGITADSAGNVFVSDANNNNIRKITSVGVVTTLAGTSGVQGSADGSGAAAQFNYPFGIAADTAGNLYVADAGNSTIRKITSAGVVTTLAGTPGVFGSADGSGAAAQFSNPYGIAADTAGNLFVADTSNQTIRKITAAGVVTTLAGTAGVVGSADGAGAAARFRNPFIGIAADTAGNLFVADSGNQTIRKITSTGVVTTVAGVAGQSGILLGNLPGSLSSPQGVALLANNTLAVTTANSVLKLVLP